MKEKIKLTIAEIFNIYFIYKLGESCIIVGISIFIMLVLNATLNINGAVILIGVGLLIYIIGIVCELYGESRNIESRNIEAFKYDGNIINSNECHVPDWVKDAYNQGIIFYYSPQDNERPCELFIKMPESIHRVSVGDYIVRGVNGEIYHCKPDRLTELFK